MVKSNYLVALVVTFAILLFVFFFIKTQEDNKFAELNKELDQIVFENTLLSSFADFDSGNKEAYCSVVSQSISSLSEKASSLERRLSAYKQSSFDTHEFYLTKRNYLIVNMFLYKSYLEAKSRCDLNTNLVLFFYAEDNSCEPDCGVIGAQLFALSRNCSSFKNFNFPFNWPSYEFIKILEAKYAVTQPATFVVDGRKFVGAMDNSKFSSLLGCS